MSKDKLSGDYLKLFLKREGKVMLGKNYSNVWLLTIVLVATFMAIAFSNGSLIFLADKMKDPFINWVDIKNDNQDKDISKFQSELESEENIQRFHYKDYEQGYEYSYFFFCKNSDDHEYYRCRFFEHLNTDLVAAILSEENVVNGWTVQSIDEIDDSSIGVIITEKVMKELGYKEAPAYIDLYSHSTGAEEVGINTYNGRGRAPLPVLGVVRKLPGNVDMISSCQFYRQNWNDIHTFNLNKEEYGRSLCYFVPADLDLSEVEESLNSALLEQTEVPFAVDDQGFFPLDQVSFKHYIKKGSEELYATFISVVPTDTLQIPFEAIKAANGAMLEKYAETDLTRLYPYVYDAGYTSTGAYLSVHFADLNAIKEFHDYAREFGVEIEMSQINAKENFNSVRLMAGVLSWAMIAFAIVCILLFIVNLLQSYFQKVKRNIGTFKAFGISNAELIRVYLIIMAAMVVISTLVAFVLVLITQELLPVFGLMKDGTYNYLSLFSLKTCFAILIIWGSSLLTVYLLMSKMLKCTPGDLIYDR